MIETAATQYTAIPERLLTTLIGLKSVLQLQGVVQSRRTGWRLRYRDEHEGGFVVHRSLELGQDESVVASVESLLQSWRMEYQAKETAAATAEQARHEEQKKSEMLRRVAQASAGGGIRNRRRVGRWYADVQKDPSAMMQFVIDGKFPRPPRRGRPAACGLW